MINVTFVIWRESFEAFLIVGILWAYLRKLPNARRSLAHLLSGIAAGLGLSFVLAYLFNLAQTELDGMLLQLFDAATMVTAAVLMTHMCIWMKRHAPTLKRELQSSAGEALSRQRLWGIAGLAALAIMREGAEIVVFLFGMGVESRTSGMMGTFTTYAALGVAATVVTAWAYVKGLSWFNPHRLFQVSTAFLLLTASSLLIFATQKLIQMDLVPSLRDQIWDTSALLDEMSGPGQVISMMTGYQASPSLMIVLVALVYWAVSLTLYFRSTHGPAMAGPVRPVKSSVG